MSENRRKALKGLALTVPAAWSAPLVQSALLPAHAQTSPEDDDPDVTITCTQEPTDTIPQDSTARATITIEPVPDPDDFVEITWFCDDEAISGPENSGWGTENPRTFGFATTSSAGPFFCPVDAVLTFRISYRGETEECGWTVVAPDP